MDDLPELPFEKVLSYLSLGDRLKARAVSRDWRKKFDIYPVKSLCYSDRPLGFISKKRQLVNGAFARNFVSSTRFAMFFRTFRRSILSNLKNLRLVDLDLKKVLLTKTLNAFGQLEELTIIRFRQSYSGRLTEFGKLTLPMLTSLQLENVQLENVEGIGEMTLDAPRLRKIRLVECLRLDLVIVHRESVERLLTDELQYTDVTTLKNLQYFYHYHYHFRPKIDRTFLSGLEQLKEVHVYSSEHADRLFEQKQRYGRTDLKIYLWGLLLNDPDDPAIDSLFECLDEDEEALIELASNPSRLADEIPFKESLSYPATNRVDPEVAIDIVSKFTGLTWFTVNGPVQDIERFLNILKNLPNIPNLVLWDDHPQDLFDRLPEHSALQELSINSAPSNLEFLRRLKDLKNLDVDCSVDVELIRNLFQELPFLSYFVFKFNNKHAAIDVIRDSGWTHRKGFEVSCDSKRAKVPDLEAAIQFFVESEPRASGQS